jgi:O-antigen ligase
MGANVGQALAALFFAAIWLFPLTAGPNPDALQTFFVAAGTLVLYATQARAWPHRLIMVALSVLAVAMLWRSPAFDLNLMAAWLAVLVLGLGASFGAALGARPVVAVAASDVVSLPSILSWITAAWLGAGVLSAGIAVCQALQVDDWFSPWFVSGGGRQVFANLRQRNLFATFNTTALLTLLYLVQRSSSLPSPGGASNAWAWRRASQWFYFLSAGLLGLAAALSYSRIGLLQLALVVGGAMLWRKQAKSAIFPLVLVCAGVYFLTAMLLPHAQVGLVAAGGVGLKPGGAFARIDFGQDHCETRGVLWHNALDLIAQRPWQGWGWHEFAWAQFSSVLEPRFCRLVDHAHNLPLQLAVELGLPVALCVCGLLFFMLRQGWRQAKRSALHAWGFAVVLAILLHSMVEFPLWHAPFQAGFGFAAGVMLAATAASESVARVGAVNRFNGIEVDLLVRWRRAWTPWCLSLAFLALTVAWLDYIRVSQAYLPVASRQVWVQRLPWIEGFCVFCNQRDFARVSLTALTPANAQWVHTEALRLLHFSPEPRLLIIAIESAQMLGQTHAQTQAQLIQQFEAAYPLPYARWVKARADGAAGEVTAKSTR